MRMFDLNAERERLGLVPDCLSCFGLCCVAHGFKASTSFAIDKLPGKPCPNLLADFGCATYGTLRQQGFSGCTAYTCFGAGQKVAQEMFGGISWQEKPETAELMFQTLPIVRQLNELLWFITEALDRCLPGDHNDELLALLEETERLTATPPDQLSWGDIDAHCRTGETLLGQVSKHIRDAALFVERGGPAVRFEQDEVPDGPRMAADGRVGDLHGADLHGADLHGADLHGADLHGVDLHGADFRGADLRGVNLAGTDLRGVDLRLAVLCNADMGDADVRWADLMGADLGRANLAGADLSAAIFLTQGQLELADGSIKTILSGPLRAPRHWSILG
jgi:hypothetical protein